MNDTETKQQFMLLRASGRSYEAIAHELGVSKKTLIKWGREYREEIRTLEEIELDALRERYRLTAQAQVKRYGDQLNRVVEELAQRDLSEVPTAKLYDVFIKLDTRLQDICPASIINDETEITTRAMKEIAEKSVTPTSEIEPWNPAEYRSLLTVLGEAIDTARRDDASTAVQRVRAISYCVASATRMLLASGNSDISDQTREQRLEEQLRGEDMFELIFRYPHVEQNNIEMFELLGEIKKEREAAGGGIGYWEQVNEERRRKGVTTDGKPIKSSIAND